MQDENKTADNHSMPGRVRADPRSTGELIQQALAAPDEDAAYEIIFILHHRNTWDDFEQVRALCESDDAHARKIGADIIGQLGVGKDTFREAAVDVLLSMIERESDPAALNAIAVALGHREDARAIPYLARLKDHPDDLVRFGVVFGLLGHEDETAIDTLIALSTDTDAVVRDWATTGLGSMIEADSPAIRAALWARVADVDEVTRGEAMRGLAQRHDRDVIRPLIDELNAIEPGDCGSLLLESAEDLADPKLYAALKRHFDAWNGDHNYLYNALVSAMERCRPER
jgi:HEAT repeat protein